MKKNFLTTNLLILLFLSIDIFAQNFIHPGIDQTAEDLAYMKTQVLSGAQPWKDGFERMKGGIDLSPGIKPFAHVQRLRGISQGIRYMRLKQYSLRPLRLLHFMLHLNVSLSCK